MINQSNYKLGRKQFSNQEFQMSKLETTDTLKIEGSKLFSFIWIKEGAGKVKTVSAEYVFSNNTMIAFNPNQSVQFFIDNNLNGIVIHFQLDFLSIHQNDNEIGIINQLNNNDRQHLFLRIDESSITVFEMLCDQMEAEMQNSNLAQNEMLVLYLKIFLINISRLNSDCQLQAQDIIFNKKEPEILQRLKEAIEENFRYKHSPCEYAKMLYTSPKTLAKISKSYYNKSLSDIINERIIEEAKRELFYTNKAIKKIAYELGYNDEYYFSRFFKVNTNTSPQKYREIECKRAVA